MFTFIVKMHARVHYVKMAVYASQTLELNIAVV